MTFKSRALGAVYVCVSLVPLGDPRSWLNGKGGLPGISAASATEYQSLSAKPGKDEDYLQQAEALESRRKAGELTPADFASQMKQLKTAARSWLREQLGGQHGQVLARDFFQNGGQNGGAYRTISRHLIANFGESDGNRMMSSLDRLLELMHVTTGPFPHLLDLLKDATEETRRGRLPKEDLQRAIRESRYAAAQNLARWLGQSFDWADAHAFLLKGTGGTRMREHFIERMGQAGADAIMGSLEQLKTQYSLSSIMVSDEVEDFLRSAQVIEQKRAQAATPKALLAVWPQSRIPQLHDWLTHHLGGEDADSLSASFIYENDRKDDIRDQLKKRFGNELNTLTGPVTIDELIEAIETLRSTTSRRRLPLASFVLSKKAIDQRLQDQTITVETYTKEVRRIRHKVRQWLARRLGERAVAKALASDFILRGQRKDEVLERLEGYVGKTEARRLMPALESFVIRKVRTWERPIKRQPSKAQAHAGSNLKERVRNWLKRELAQPMFTETHDFIVPEKEVEALLERLSQRFGHKAATKLSSYIEHTLKKLSLTATHQGLASYAQDAEDLLRARDMAPLDTSDFNRKRRALRDQLIRWLRRKTAKEETARLARRYVIHGQQEEALSALLVSTLGNDVANQYMSMLEKVAVALSPNHRWKRKPLISTSFPFLVNRRHMLRNFVPQGFTGITLESQEAVRLRDDIVKHSAVNPSADLLSVFGYKSFETQNDGASSKKDRFLVFKDAVNENRRGLAHFSEDGLKAIQVFEVPRRRIRRKH